MIRLDGISVTSAGRTGIPQTLLDTVVLSIPAGDWVVVAGPNGSGKTTLLKALAGVVPLSSGSVSYEGYKGGAPVFSLMLQDADNQFVAGRVRTELVLSAGRRAGGLGRTGPGPAGTGSPEKRIREAVERFSLGPVLERNPHTLSGGEKQRLAMAGVWLSQPDVLLLDEPVSFLDGRSRRECAAFVREMNENGVTVVWASPGGDELVYASTVVYLEKGGVLFAGDLERFYTFAREHDRVHALPGIFQLGRKLVEIARGGNEDDKDDGDSAAANGAVPPGGAEPSGSFVPPGDASVLAFRDASFSYAEGTFALERLHAALAPGECVGVTGPNGSGKTTLLELAGGILKPASGSVSVARSPKSSARHRIGGDERVDIFYLFQSPERMFFTETVFEEIAYGLKHLGVPPGDLLFRASESLRKAGLDPDVFLNRSPFRLSFGEMRRLALAIAVALKPRVLLVDEPSSCLDAGGMAVLGAVIRSLTREGTAVLAASHDIDFLAELCGRILFLEHGAVAGELALAGQALPQAAEWPGSEKPFVLELQDALAAHGPRFEPRPLSRGGFIRALIEHARTERNGTS